MTKIYTNGNYLFIEKDAILYEGFSSEVLVRRLNSTSTEFHFSNLNGWTDVAIDISEIQDESGTPYTLQSFIEFYTTSTGGSSSGSSSSGDSATETTLLAILNKISKTSYEQTFVATQIGTEVFTLNEVANNVSVTISRANTLQNIDFTHTTDTDSVSVNDLQIGDIVVIRLFF